MATISSTPMAEDVIHQDPSQITAVEAPDVKETRKRLTENLENRSPKERPLISLDADEQRARYIVHFVAEGSFRRGEGGEMSIWVLAGSYAREKQVSFSATDEVGS